MKTAILAPYGVELKYLPLSGLSWKGRDMGIGTTEAAVVFPVARGGRQTALFTSNFTDNGAHVFTCDYDTDPDSVGFIFAGDFWLDGPQPIDYLEFMGAQITADGRNHNFDIRLNVAQQTWGVGRRVLAPLVPETLPVGEWFHFEIAFHREDKSNIYYDAVHVAGVTKQIQFMETHTRKEGQQPGLCSIGLKLAGRGQKGTIQIYTSNLKMAKW